MKGDFGAARILSLSHCLTPTPSRTLSHTFSLYAHLHAHTHTLTHTRSHTHTLSLFFLSAGLKYSENVLCIPIFFPMQTYRLLIYTEKFYFVLFGGKAEKVVGG